MKGVRGKAGKGYVVSLHKGVAHRQQWYSHEMAIKQFLLGKFSRGYSRDGRVRFQGNKIYVRADRRDANSIAFTEEMDGPARAKGTYTCLGRRLVPNSRVKNTLFVKATQIAHHPRLHYLLRKQAKEQGYLEYWIPDPGGTVGENLMLMEDLLEYTSARARKSRIGYRRKFYVDLTYLLLDGVQRLTQTQNRKVKLDLPDTVKIKLAKAVMVDRQTPQAS